MIVLAFGFHSLYPWTDPSSPEMAATDELLRAGRFTYLSPPFVYARMIVIIGLWILFALRMRQISLAGDASRAAGNSAYTRLFRYSGVFVPLFAITFALSSYDWIISLEPKWFSTMFSVYIFAGSFVQAIAAIALATVMLKRKQLWGKDGALVDGPELFLADLGYQIDNMEGIGVHKNAQGETILTLVSDDNFSALQRTILLQFRLVE